MRFAPRISRVSLTTIGQVATISSESVIIWGILVCAEDAVTTNFIIFKNSAGDALFTLNLGTVGSPRQTSFEVPFLVDKGLTVTNGATLGVNITVFLSNVGA